MFQSTHSLRSATLPDGCKSHLLAVSIHALLAECDYKPSRSRNHVHRFNPRTPCGVRRPPPSRQSDCLTFQSTHSLRSATHRMRAFRERHPVSIHALLAECDFRKYPVRRADLVVSIHALLAECDGHGLGIRVQLHRFQSTHSLRSATSDKKEVRDHEGVSIHALLAECDGMIVLVGNAQESVSIHALLAECDSGRKNSIYLSVVSIHALLAECDRTGYIQKAQPLMFQSTHSLRSATKAND